MPAKQTFNRRPASAADALNTVTRQRRRLQSLLISSVPMSLGLALPNAWAQGGLVTNQEIVVTANPLGSGLFELVNPATQLSGPNLDFRRASTIGETLSGELGVSSSYFGPNSSRPVIRGLDGDRIRIMQNGSTSVDASSMSFDHASAMDPLVAERIEVVRGPAALLYGGNAIGGVVNSLDNRIPTEPINQLQGRAEGRLGSADRERSAAVVLEGGNGQVAVHADAYQRNHSDVRIPDFARSTRQRALDAPGLDQPRHRLPNSFSEGEGGALGASLTWDRGYAGLSFGGLRSSYGTPAEPEVKIDMRKDTIALAGELRRVNEFVDSVRVQFNHSDYEHQEKNKLDGMVNTTFRNRGQDGRIELRHAPLAGLRGVWGLQFAAHDFSALGDEAFVPGTRSKSSALFAFEELRRTNWRLNFGVRGEHSQVRSAGDNANAATGRFGARQQRQFSTISAALGGLYTLQPGLTLAGNYGYTERAPTHYELFANGPHAATGTFEVGNPDTARERSHSFDLALRGRQGPHQWSVGVFQQRFANYLLLAPTGRNRAADGRYETAPGSGLAASGEAADLPEYQYRQAPALFRGAEIGGRWRALQSAGTLDFDLKFDTVRATQLDTGQPLPRMAPMRLSLGALYQSGPWHARGELQRIAAQNRTAPNELPSDAYTLVNAFISYRLKSGATSWDLFARGNNLGNADARTHTSLIKDIAPLPGRTLVLGLRATF